jgi:antitoxin component YwqK of YwqJK toxin-antitoxin module
MSKATKKKQKYAKYHKDSSIWAKGTTVGGLAEGYWEWFRKDGSKMRSGYFAQGKQTGKWTTYDKKGKVFKITDFRSAKK